MPSLSSALGFGPQSLSSGRDPIESYRRTQAYTSISVSASEDAEFEDEVDIDADFGVNAIDETVSLIDPVISKSQWDAMHLATGSSKDVVSVSPTTPIAYRTYSAVQTLSPAIAKAGERFPLLRKTTSQSCLGRSCRLPAATDISTVGKPDTASVPLGASRVSVHNKATTDPQNAAAEHFSGHSTFGQTLFNAIAILLGIGMLSEPLAFAYAGWIGGAILITVYGLLTCYTAKLLARIILSDPHLKTYCDVGQKAFGPSSSLWISALFCVDLFAVSVALVTLFADSLYAVVPTYSPNTYKIFCLVILIPTVLMPLSVLSYTSILGIISTLLIIAVVLIDGFSKLDGPGSLWSPADTSLGVRGPGELGVAFGLFMASFGGHAVIPSLVRDMADPSQFNRMINSAFAVSTAICAVIGIAGYVMFGNSVSDEFSQDLMKHSVYPGLNEIALWGLVLSPLSKFALTTRPLNLTLEVALGIDTSTHASKPVEDTGPRLAQVALRRALTAIERSVVAMLSVAVSILVPEFSAMMAFLGACTSFVICVIGPLAAKVAIAGRCGLWDAFLLASSIVMAVWGTCAAVWSA